MIYRPAHLPNDHMLDEFERRITSMVKLEFSENHIDIDSFDIDEPHIVLTPKQIWHLAGGTRVRHTPKSQMI